MPENETEIEEFDDQADQDKRKAAFDAANEEHLAVRSGADPK